MKLKLTTTVISLLMCTLCASAQSSLTFTPAQWNFGTIKEADGRVSHIFTGTNTSGKPLVILEVFTSCGCTVPEFSKKPIFPGQQTQIKVSFDPRNRPGAFNKELTIFDSERRKVAKLTIRGMVIERPKTIEELYPVATDRGLRLTQSLSTFSYIYHGRPTMSAIGIVNDSSKPLQLELRPEEQSGFLTLDYPRTLPAGARGEIRIGYHIPAKSASYGTIRDVLIPRIDGLDDNIRIVAHGLAVDNPELSNEIYHPKAEVDKYILKFGLLKRGIRSQKLAFRITNRGTGTLRIRAVEGGEPFGTTLRAGQQVEAGQSITAYVTIDPAKQDYGPATGFLTIVTNDPSRPVMKVRLTAVIEA